MSIHWADAAEWLRALLCRSEAKAGRDVAAFEQAFRDYLGCSFARATHSGRDAMVLALRVVGVRPGDEVIVPAYTLGELLAVLQGEGYTLVPADVEPDTFNIDVGNVERHIGPKTRAVLALHLHGAPCNIEAICDVAKRNNLLVVEDCAHALGASVAGHNVGTFGDAAFFSLESNKAVPTYGGGVLVVKNPQQAEQAAAVLDLRERKPWPVLRKALRYWLEEAVIRSPLYAPVARVVFSARVRSRFERFYRRSHGELRRELTAYSAFQARLGLKALARLPGRNERLNAQWSRLAEQLPPGFVAQKRNCVGEPAFYNFVALSERIAPAELRRRLLRKGVDIGIGSEVMDDCGRLLGAEDCPVAARVFEQAVILPLYEGLTERRFRRVVRGLRLVAEAEGRP